MLSYCSVVSPETHSSPLEGCFLGFVLFYKHRANPRHDPEYALSVLTIYSSSLKHSLILSFTHSFINPEHPELDTRNAAGEQDTCDQQPCGGSVDLSSGCQLFLPR